MKYRDQSRFLPLSEQREKGKKIARVSASDENFKASQLAYWVVLEEINFLTSREKLLFKSSSNENIKISSEERRDLLNSPQYRRFKQRLDNIRLIEYEEERVIAENIMGSNLVTLSPKYAKQRLFNSLQLLFLRDAAAFNIRDFHTGISPTGISLIVNTDLISETQADPIHEAIYKAYEKLKGIYGESYSKVEFIKSFFVSQSKIDGTTGEVVGDPFTWKDSVGREFVLTLPILNIHTAEIYVQYLDAISNQVQERYNIKSESIRKFKEKCIQLKKDLVNLIIEENYPNHYTEKMDLSSPDANCEQQPLRMPNPVQALFLYLKDGRKISEKDANGKEGLSMFLARSFQELIGELFKGLENMVTGDDINMYINGLRLDERGLLTYGTFSQQRTATRDNLAKLLLMLKYDQYHVDISNTGIKARFDKLIQFIIESEILKKTSAKDDLDTLMGANNLDPTGKSWTYGNYIYAEYCLGYNDDKWVIARTKVNSITTVNDGVEVFYIADVDSNGEIQSSTGPTADWDSFENEIIKFQGTDSPTDFSNRINTFLSDVLLKDIGGSVVKIQDLHTLLVEASNGDQVNNPS